MKAIKNGKRYDTENSELIATYDNGLGISDFRNLSEDLYRTKKGNWFLVGSGGAMTKYSIPAGNMKSGSSDNIVPITETEAFEWLQHHEETYALEKYFSEVIEEA